MRASDNATRSGGPVKRAGSRRREPPPPGAPASKRAIAQGSFVFALELIVALLARGLGPVDVVGFRLLRPFDGDRRPGRVARRRVIGDVGEGLGELGAVAAR